jgi:hypothetical protein
LSITLKVAAVGVAGALSILGASAAQAATVTLGSPLTNALPSRPIAVSATVQQTTLPGVTLVAPFNGQIRSWTVINASGGWTLQVLHPSAGGFVSTGSTHGEALGPGVITFSARLPIEVGDSIGLASDSASSTLGTSDATPVAAFDAYIPPLTDNSAPRSSSTSGTRELGFNATVASNCIVPKVKGNTVKKATNKLLAAGCTKGKVKKKGGKRVTKQRPPAGTEVAPETPVKLTLGS